MLNAGHSTIASRAWDPDFYERSPLYDPLGGAASRLRGPHWPTLDRLQSLVGEPPAVHTGSGLPLALVRHERSWTLGFEARAYLHGELQARTANWHDLFNVLAWRVFPRAKAALNRAHYEALPEADGGRRGSRRDALTLFDESGVIVASVDDDLLDALRAFRWHDLFWKHRERMRERMRFVVFGHALYDKALAPYVGLTGHAMLFETDPAFVALAVERQTELLDGRLAERIAEPGALASAAALSPLPLLGVPGWWPDNERESFYANERYFRRGRSRAAS